ncbi:Rv3235 family protein [Pseudonocardia sp. H11422]|uniref:Rv3235 family protein n=1 Tax=Pseudonocardia sp. H11422 TaxID=2835866 RepID=UPI001BDCE2B2|nr:Rv3235 family protein [Pseudonocardia sp. H11422]
MSTTTVAPRRLEAPARTGGSVRLRALHYEPGTGPGTEPEPDRPWIGAVPGPSAPDSRPPPGRLHPSSSEGGLARRRAQETLRLVLEVIDGRRSAAQLDRLLEPSVLRYVVAAATQPAVRRDGCARLRSIRLDQPRPGAAEVAAVCRLGGRIRALAARFDRDDATGHWRCTALRIG